MIALATACPPTLAGSDSAFNIHEIAPGVFVHQGIHVPFDHAQHDDIANIGFIVGERCAAIIDTGGSIRIGQALRQAVREQTDRPICYVINTHGHYDHVLGNASFQADRPTFAGHADLGEAIDASREYFLKQFGSDLGPDPRPESVIGPGFAVAGRAEIDLGGRVLELIAHPPAHTFSDLTVFDRTTGTLWLGDLLFIDRTPALDGSLSAWIRLMEELHAFPAARAVPGHGPASADWPRSADRQLNYLRTLRDQVRAGIAQGLLMEELVESAAAGSDPEWQLYEQHHGRNVGKAYLELEWE
ncbi:MAG: quinoprotein relay system zinc metallohydrolase 2 [Gammaproteobacteria bacterium]|nr:quinoprotein relay system zinc metallohydrolase 2 [Gammaproteobacteria bacterium]